MTSPEDQAVINAALEAQRQKARGTVNPVAVQQTTTTGVLPAMNLKSMENWRAFFHQVVAVIVPILVTANLITENAAAAWVPFIFAIADNVLSVGNTTDRIRKAVYAVVGLAQTGGLLASVLTTVAPTYVPVGGAILAVVSAFMARFYTPTTTIVATQ